MFQCNNQLRDYRELYIDLRLYFNRQSENLNRSDPKPLDYRESHTAFEKSCQLLGVPGQSPSPVLTWPCIALLWSSDGIRHFRCSMVDGYKITVQLYCLDNSPTFA
jgi:hypothetical protein